MESLQVPGRKLTIVCDVSAVRLLPHHFSPHPTNQTPFQKTGRHLPLHPRSHLQRGHDLRQADRPSHRPPRRLAAAERHLHRPPPLAAPARGVRGLQPRPASLAAAAQRLEERPCVGARVQALPGEGGQPASERVGAVR